MGEKASKEIQEKTKSTTTKKIEMAQKTKTLNLSGQNLRSLPDKLRSVDTLKILDVRRNKLASLPAGVGNVQGLKKLHATSNEFKAIPPCLAQLTSLQEFDIANNHITALPDVLPWPNLQILDLSNNRLTVLPTDCFSSVPSLSVLLLNGNRLTSLCTSLFGLQSLQQLELKNNTLTSFGREDEDFTAMKRLHTLKVSHNKTLTMLPAALFTTTPMIDLEFDGCGFTLDQLKDQDWYPQWSSKKTENINKQLQGGLVVKLQD